MESVGNSRREFEKLRASAVEEHLTRRFKSRGVKPPASYRDALTAITIAAADHAFSVNATLEPYGPNNLYDQLEHAISLIEDLQNGLDQSAAINLTSFWYHNSNFVNDINLDKIPSMDRSTIELAVGSYIDLPYRSKNVDRLLVDILVAMEIYAFALATFRAPAIFGWNTHLSRVNPLRYWARGVFQNIIIGAVIFTFLRLLNDNGMFPSDWMWLSTAIVVLLCAFSTLSTIRLPFFWSNVQKIKKQTFNLFDQMSRVYRELDGDGPVSLGNIAIRAQSAAEAGVVWPASLFALFDDLKDRGERREIAG